MAKTSHKGSPVVLVAAGIQAAKMANDIAVRLRHEQALLAMTDLFAAHPSSVARLQTGGYRPAWHLLPSDQEIARVARLTGDLDRRAENLDELIRVTLNPFLAAHPEGPLVLLLDLAVLRPDRLRAFLEGLPGQPARPVLVAGLIAREMSRKDIELNLAELDALLRDKLVDTLIAVDERAPLTIAQEGTHQLWRNVTHALIGLLINARHRPSLLVHLGGPVNGLSVASRGVALRSPDARRRLARWLRREASPSAELVRAEAEHAMRAAFEVSARTYRVGEPRDSVERHVVMTVPLPKGSAAMEAFIESFNGWLTRHDPSLVGLYTHGEGERTSCQPLGEGRGSTPIVNIQASIFTPLKVGSLAELATTPSQQTTLPRMPGRPADGLAASTDLSGSPEAAPNLTGPVLENVL